MLQETHHIITAPHGVEVYGLGKEPLGEYLYSSVHVVLEKCKYSSLVILPKELQEVDVHSVRYLRH